MKLHSLLILSIATCIVGFQEVQADITNTKHNLSVSGPGAVKAVSESEICVFCHTPHNAVPNRPLWNRSDPGLTYTPYSSSTAIALPGQPTRSSILCLSCHDGTIALGDTLSRTNTITMQGGVTTMPSGPGRLGTDLSDDHPISFVYDSSLASQRGQLVDPGTLTGPVKPDNTGQMQCTSCHDPHDDTFGKFLLVSNLGSTLCRTCHVLNHWITNPHNLSNATWNGINPDPWPETEWNTVSNNACQNCHQPHSVGSPQRLLNYAIEEDNCTACHNGNVANMNVSAEFNKISRHPIMDFTGIHDPSEPGVVASRHVECMDCHNPHQVGANLGTISDKLSGARGINLSGTEVSPANFEYEICFRCHADSLNKPPALTSRQISQTNVRLEFQTSNPSFHPVTGVGRNPNVPSLIAPLTPSSTIKCTDCHNSNSSSSSGPNGPHGSTFSPILQRQYLTLDFTRESPSTYALCYGCHDRDSIRSDDSFKEHDKHIRGDDVPCNICHDPHGISSTQGNTTNNSKLINFDTSVVQPDSSGRLRFESTGVFRGRCFLNCHGEEHDPKNYP